MIMNPGMLFFGLIDSGIAFFLVYYTAKARFGGDKSGLARILAAILGTLTFVIYFGVIVWFNTEVHTVSQSAKLVVYLAPIVLSILMVALVLLSQPPGKKAEEGANAEGGQDTDGEGDSRESVEEEKAI